MITLFYNQPRLSPTEGGLWRLDEAWAIRLPLSGRVLEIAAGFCTDGASIPRLLWTLVGHPFDPLLLAPALAHDALYEARLVSRSEADAQFRALLRLNDDTAMNAQLCWLGVRIGGWWPWVRYSARSIVQARELCRLSPATCTVLRLATDPDHAAKGGCQAGLAWKAGSSRTERFDYGWENLPDSMQRKVMEAIRGHVAADPRCHWCGTENRNLLTAHHVIPVAVDPARALDGSNLLTLCHACHFVVGHYGNWRTFNQGIQSATHNFGRTTPNNI
ncbi:MAG: DUF1353 domain-containing protein [Kiritimatiellaeota bacterium]|nr:DUF1353 domain-containing protein [Kiritimatiellota bacterium]